MRLENRLWVEGVKCLIYKEFGEWYGKRYEEMTVRYRYKNGLTVKIFTIKYNIPLKININNKIKKLLLLWKNLQNLPLTG